MTRITIDHDHPGVVRKSSPKVRFDETHEASVRHERAQELVAAHDDVDYALPIPTEYDELRSVASGFPTDKIAGNDSADMIVSFLEQFSADEIERLRDDPELLEVTVENRRERYSVAEPDDDPDPEPEPADAGTDDGEAE